MPVPTELSRLASDEAWRPLFADVRVEVPQDPFGLAAVLGGVETDSSTRICWASPARAELPLALPPPWVGTVTVVIPAGCWEAEIGEDAGAVSVAVHATGATLTTRATLDGRVVWSGRVLAKEPDESDLLGGRSESEVLRFYPGCVRRAWDEWLVGDALPWTRGERARSEYADFLATAHVSVDVLAHRTAKGPYAGAAIVARQPFWPQDGSPAAARARLGSSLAEIDPTKLTEPQRRELAWVRRDLAGWPIGAPTVGTATILVDPRTLEVEVDGRVVLKRAMDMQTAGIQAKTATPVEVTVQVPASEAVFVRTTGVSFAASDGGWWDAHAESGFAALLPGHRYEVKIGTLQRVAPSGTTCVVAAEGQDLHIGGDEPAHERPITSSGGGPGVINVWPVEPGLYTVTFDGQGAARVAYAAGACAQ